MSSDSIKVDTTTHLLTSLVTRHTGLWKKLGNAESKLLALDIEDITITAPIYVSGLARSGSTILLEMLADQNDTASHTYGDFPFLFTPCWWNMVAKLLPGQSSQMQERAHGDGIHINQNSPEAMEEMLWMSFFKQLHTTAESNVLSGNTYNQAFEQFYRDHIKKILHIRKASRYLAKANYNVTRLAYLIRLFPDARFIIPVRHPVAHVESLIRQHARFTMAAENNPRVISQMEAGGHFEFGPHRIPIHTGDNARMQQVIEAWEEGNEAKGYALQWSMVYDYLHVLRQNDSAVKAATMLIPFEECCKKPHESLENLFAHCQLQIQHSTLAEKASKIHAPRYQSALGKNEISTIENICAETARHYGYG